MACWTMLLVLFHAVSGCSDSMEYENGAVGADEPAGQASAAPDADPSPEGIPATNPAEADLASDDATAQSPVTDEEVAVQVDTASGGPSSTQVNQAIQWFVDHNGSTKYEGYCEKAVEAAFGRTGVFPSAKAAYQCAKHKNLLHLSRTAADASKIPRGATLFYNTSANYHVALFEGYVKTGKVGGRVRSTSVKGKIGQTQYPYFQNPLGWAVMDWHNLTRACN